MNNALTEKGVKNQMSILKRAKNKLESIVEILDYDPQMEMYRTLRQLTSKIENLDSRITMLESKT